MSLQARAAQRRDPYTRAWREAVSRPVREE